MKCLENEVNSALGYDPADIARSLAELEFFVPNCHCDFFFFFFFSGIMHQQGCSGHQQGWSGHQQQLKMCHNLIWCLMSISWTPLKAPHLSILGRDFGVESRISRRSQGTLIMQGGHFCMGWHFCRGPVRGEQLQWMEMGNFKFYFNTLGNCVLGGSKQRTFLYFQGIW